MNKIEERCLEAVLMDSEIHLKLNEADAKLILRGHDFDLFKIVRRVPQNKIKNGEDEYCDECLFGLWMESGNCWQSILDPNKFENVNKSLIWDSAISALKNGNVFLSGKEALIWSWLEKIKDFWVNDVEKKQDVLGICSHRNFLIIAEEFMKLGANPNSLLGGEEKNTIFGVAYHEPMANLLKKYGAELFQEVGGIRAFDAYVSRGYGSSWKTDYVKKEVINEIKNGTKVDIDDVFAAYKTSTTVAEKSKMIKSLAKHGLYDLVDKNGAGIFFKLILDGVLNGEQTVLKVIQEKEFEKVDINGKTVGDYILAGFRKDRGLPIYDYKNTIDDLKYANFVYDSLSPSCYFDTKKTTKISDVIIPFYDKELVNDDSVFFKNLIDKKDFKERFVLALTTNHIQKSVNSYRRQDKLGIVDVWQLNEWLHKMTNVKIDGKLIRELDKDWDSLCMIIVCKIAEIAMSPGTVGWEESDVTKRIDVLIKSGANLEDMKKLLDGALKIAGDFDKKERADCIISFSGFEELMSVEGEVGAILHRELDRNNLLNMVTHKEFNKIKKSL